MFKKLVVAGATAFTALALPATAWFGGGFGGFGFGRSLAFASSFGGWGGWGGFGGLGFGGLGFGWPLWNWW